MPLSFDLSFASLNSQMYCYHFTAERVKKDTKNYPEYQWFFEKVIPGQGELEKMAIEDALDQGVIDGYQEGLGAVADILLLAKTDMLIGKFTSHIERVAYQIMVAEDDCVKPFISLDAPWCFDHGVKSGKGDYGTFWC